MASFRGPLFSVEFWVAGSTGVMGYIAFCLFAFACLRIAFVDGRVCPNPSALLRHRTIPILSSLSPLSVFVMHKVSDSAAINKQQQHHVDTQESQEVESRHHSLLLAPKKKNIYIPVWEGEDLPLYRTSPFFAL